MADAAKDVSSKVQGLIKGSDDVASLSKQFNQKIKEISQVFKGDEEKKNQSEKQKHLSEAAIRLTKGESSSTDEQQNMKE